MTTLAETNGAAWSGSSPAWPHGAVYAAVLALPECCYRCGAVTRSIVGALVPSHLTDDRDGFLEFELVAPLIAARVTGAKLAACGVGAIKLRRSRQRPEG